MAPTILVTTPKLAAAGAARLAEAGARVLYVGAEDPKGDLARLLAQEPIEGIISRTLPLGAELIASCPSLRAISRHGVGYDAVDIAAAAARGIPVSVAAGTNAISVAEQTIGLIFAVARRIPALDGAVRAGEWPRAAAGLQLAGRRLGLIGFGRIARLVAERAKALGLAISVFDPLAPDLPEGITRADDLAALLAEADIVSLHCPLTPATRGLIGAEAIAEMRPAAILINTARGGLIDELALAGALRAGKLWGAGLDTLSDEPPAPDHPLIALPQVVISPHVGGNTDAALEATALSAAENLLAMLEGRPLDPALIVNRDLLPRKETA